MAPQDSEEVVIFDLVGQQIMGRLKGHKGQVTQIKFDPNGQWLSTLSGDFTVRLWPMSAIETYGKGAKNGTTQPQ